MDDLERMRRRKRLREQLDEPDNMVTADIVEHALAAGADGALMLVMVQERTQFAVASQPDTLGDSLVTGLGEIMRQAMVQAGAHITSRGDIGHVTGFDFGMVSRYVSNGIADFVEEFAQRSAPAHPAQRAHHVNSMRDLAAQIRAASWAAK